MKQIYLGVIAALVMAGPSEAATVNLTSFATVVSETDTVTDNASSTHDTAVEGPLHYVTSEANLPPGSVNGSALSGVDLSLGAGRARVRAQKDPNSGETSSNSLATTRITDQYTVSGNGRARVNFTVYGDISSLTDIGNPGQFMTAFGSLDVTHNGVNYSDTLSSSDPADSLFQMANGSFHRLLSFTFDVMDADTIDVSAMILAQIGLSQSQAAAFDLEVDVKSGLRLVGLDGASIVPVDGGAIAPVPLPASGLLLLFPMAGMIVMRRRKSETS